MDFVSESKLTHPNCLFCLINCLSAGERLTKAYLKGYRVLQLRH